MYERLSLESQKRIFNKLKGFLVIVANHPFSWFETVVLVTLLKQVGSDFWMMCNYLLNKITEI